MVTRRVKFSRFVFTLCAGIGLQFAASAWAQTPQGISSPADLSAAATPTTPKVAAKEKEDREEEHKPVDPDTGKSTLSHDTLGLLPNPYESRGIKFSLSYVADLLSNLDGGAHRGSVYDGRLNAAIDVDFATLANWQGLSFHANVFAIHGPGLTREFIGNLVPVSSIEAKPAVRLYEAWFEQKWNGEKYSLRAGQLAADAEFVTSKYTDIFLNSTYGWPAFNGINLPSGGPWPPLAAPGVRVKADINDSTTLLAAVFNGDPAGPGLDDPQSRNLYGINFRLRDAPLALGEVQYAYNQKPGQPALPGTIKIGGWYHAGNFNDQRVALNGVSQADPSAATPAQLRSDYGIYSVYEQLLVRFAKDDISRGIGFFARVATGPSDRNLIDLYADGGFNIMGLSEARPHDKIGLGFAYAHISGSARDLDRDFQILQNDPRPIRNSEALATLSYLAEIKTGWTLLPTAQYVMRPGGGYVMDVGAPRAVRNAAVIGMRTVLKF